MRVTVFNGFKRFGDRGKPKAPQLNKDELEFLPAALEIDRTPPSPVGLMTAWLIIALFLIAIIWACVGHVDEVSIATGKVIPSGYTKTIQSFDTGVIKIIHVQDGDKVEQGQVLIELDTTITAADLARQRKEAAHYRLEIQRLLAEQQGTLGVPDAKIAATPDEIEYQTGLYRSRVAEYQSKVAAAEQAVSQAQAALNSASAARDKDALQLEIAAKREGSMKELMDIGSVAEFQYLEYQNQRIGLQQDLTAHASDAEKARAALAQSTDTLHNTISERERDIAEKLVEDWHQLQSVEEELRKAEEKYRLSTVTSPIAGTVHQLSVHTVGGVVTPAQILMLVVPEGEQMEIEAMVANRDIGFLYVGQEAQIKVETFDYRKYGTLPAKLIEISSDAVNNDKTAEKGNGKTDDKDDSDKTPLVYRAILKTDVDHFDLANGKKIYLSPGMAVTAEIKTRQKRIIEYFMDPFIKYRNEGLRER